MRLRTGVVALLVLVSATCSIHRVETAKSLYDSARSAQAAGDDPRAIVLWKAVADMFS